ncbi:hypothetical protein [Xanthomonas sp. GPE 39]|uniref:hypothetical protein n=1 Tax=Xanthomonas sp. GPE 39 TaxID=1583099 RepID=UPI001F3A08D9|nr:hypothetical protein [Xanthomonas sp. GPE 39]
MTGSIACVTPVTTNSFSPSDVCSAALHDISDAIDLLQAETREEHGRQTQNLRTGAIGKAVSIETFPVRDFSITTTLKASAD